VVEREVTLFKLLLGLLIGFVMGWVSQRSRFCIQGAFRDLFLFKETYLLDGVLAAVLVFALVHFVGYSHAP
jgi:uncharacterized membrane protein YedE/YeeE